MRLRTATWWLFIPVSVIIAAGAKPVARSLPPGRPHLLTIEGENTITFLPEVRLNPFRIDYRARVEYLVNTRSGVEAEARSVGTVKKKTARKTASGADQIKRKKRDQAE